MISSRQMKMDSLATLGAGWRFGWVVWCCCASLWLGEHPVFALSVGERVQAIDRVNLRATPGGVFQTTRRLGTQGTIVEGPVVAPLGANILTWFRVDFDGGADGWVAEVGLASIAIPPGVPSNPAPGLQSSPGLGLTVNRVTLTWGAVREATFYDLGVFDVVTGAALVNSTNAVTIAQFATNDVFSPTVSYTLSLPPGRDYRWSVAAGNPAGDSPYSAVLFFRSPAAFLSAASSLTQPPAAQTAEEIQSHGFVLDLALEVGRAFRVQASSDLQTWTEVTNFVNTAQAVQVVDAAAKPLSRRFYRVVSP